MLNAVQQFLAHNVLDGTPSPYLENLIAVVQPPPVSFLDENPYAFLWAGTGDFARQTAPRQQTMGAATPVQAGGYQKYTWHVEISLHAVMLQDDANIEQGFPCLFDSVVKTLATTPIPTIVTDPATQQQTQILTIAERGHHDYATVAVTGAAGQSLVRFGCSLTIDVEEKVDFTGGVVEP